MKDYIEQIYSEGLATTFYLKPVNYLKKNIKNKRFQNLLIWVLKWIYTLIVLSFAGIYIYIKLIKK